MKAIHNPLAFDVFLILEALLEARWSALERNFFHEMTAPTGPPRVKILTSALEERLPLTQGRPVGQRTTSNEP